MATEPKSCKPPLGPPHLNGKTTKYKLRFFKILPLALLSLFFLSLDQPTSDHQAAWKSLESKCCYCATENVLSADSSSTKIL